MHWWSNWLKGRIKGKTMNLPSETFQQELKTKQKALSGWLTVMLHLLLIRSAALPIDPLKLNLTFKTAKTDIWGRYGGMHTHTHRAGYAPLRRRPVRSAGVRSPDRPRCRSVAVSPPDGGYMSSAPRRCWPGAPYPVAGRRGGRCCTSSLPPGKQTKKKQHRGSSICKLLLKGWFRTKQKQDDQLAKIDPLSYSVALVAVHERTEIWRRWNAFKLLHFAALLCFHNTV